MLRSRGLGTIWAEMELRTGHLEDTIEQMHPGLYLMKPTQTTIQPGIKQWVGLRPKDTGRPLSLNRKLLLKWVYGTLLNKRIGWISSWAPPGLLNASNFQMEMCKTKRAILCKRWLPDWRCWLFWESCPCCELADSTNHASHEFDTTTID